LASAPSDLQGLDSRSQLHICSWNIHIGLERGSLLRSVRENRHFEGLDILFLQEASADQHGTDAHLIAQALGSGYSAVQRNLDRRLNRTRGLGFVWNPAMVRVTDVDVLELPHVRHPKVKRLHRYALTALRARRRWALTVTAEIDGHTLRAYNIHLNPGAFAYQMEQFQAILRDDGHRPAVDVVVLIGDFNSLRVDRRRWSAWFSELEQRGYTNVSEDVDWTFRTFRSRRFLRQKLDNILVKTRLPLEHSAHSQDVPGSDHLPLFARLSWTAGVSSA
jgi:endonuclease/exonuclease/phosphatase family metal-dependent hydrolase